MTKILVYGNRKSDDIYYDISTPEKEDASYLALFKILDEQWGSLPRFRNRAGRSVTVCPVW